MAAIRSNRVVTNASNDCRRWISRASASAHVRWQPIPKPGNVNHGIRLNRCMREFIDIIKSLNEGIKDTPQFIENPNSSGQGHHPEYANHPFHDVLTKHQYRYSHSTPIRSRDGDYNVHHTYKHLDMKDNVVGIHQGHWEAHRLGQRRNTRGNTPVELDRFLRGHVQRSTRRISAADADSRSRRTT